MDYTKQPLWFKLKKTMRYISMYGLKRTWIKVQGQLHMKRTYDPVPENRYPAREGMVFGLIGCGNYGFSNIAYYLRKKYGACIRACMDADINRAVSLGAYYKVPLCTDKAEDLIDDPAIRLIYIASNHASHADYAIRALEKGKHVYIEKPHVVRDEQLSRLVDAMERSPGMVFLGYNRPGSRFGKLIREQLDREPGSAVINWFVAGHEIAPDHWYFKPEEGGRVLGNLCHWTDFTLAMAGPGSFPVKIIPARHEKSDSNIAVTYVFRNGTVAAITFSAKGHTFEGVKERLSVHKGDCLITMDDYKTMTVEVVAKKRKFRNRLRDHGHQRNILQAADAVLNDLEYSRKDVTEHVANSGWLMLKTKEALDHDRVVMVNPPFPEK